MISKEDFVKIINRLKDNAEMQEKINDLYRDTVEAKISDFNNVSYVGIYFEDIVVELLENIFNDKMNISYWLYDIDYGRKYKDGCVMKTNGTIIDISTPEKLYDILIKDMEGDK